MSDSSKEANENIENIFKEISRVLRFGGRYICITLAQDHILKALFNFFPNENWIVRIHKVKFDYVANINSIVFIDL